jgi:hypothetical protein
LESHRPTLAASVDAFPGQHINQEKFMSSKKTKSTKPSKRKTAKADEPAAKVARNGITQPGEGTACRAIWDALDALTAKGAELTFEVLRETVDSQTADATIRTQRQRWKQHHA